MPAIGPRSTPQRLNARSPRARAFSGARQPVIRAMTLCQARFGSAGVPAASAPRSTRSLVATGAVIS